MFKNYTIKIPKINFLIIIFLLSILTNYKVPQKFNYFYILIIILAIIINILSLLLKKNHIKINISSFAFVIISFLFLFLSSVIFGKIRYFIEVYFPLYLIIFYTYLKMLKYGEEFMENFLKQFMVLMNVFSVLNLYQVVFHKPILLNYLNEGCYFFLVGTYGTSSFRTISVFGHPILCGLFFVITFIFNLYLLKGYRRYILECIIIINIYSTSSRSSWLTLIIIMLLLSGDKILNRDKIKIYKKTTFKRVLSLYLTFGSTIVILGVIIANYSKILSTIITRFGDSLSASSTDISNLQRVGTLKLIFSNFVQDTLIHKLLGNGISTAQIFMTQNLVVIKDFATTDNMYITWLFEFGVLGFLFIISWTTVLLSNYNSNKSIIIYKLCYYILLIISIESFYFESIGAWYPLTIILGITISVLSFKYKDLRN